MLPPTAGTQLTLVCDVLEVDPTEQYDEGLPHRGNPQERGEYEDRPDAEGAPVTVRTLKRQFVPLSVTNPAKETP